MKSKCADRDVCVRYLIILKHVSLMLLNSSVTSSVYPNTTTISLFSFSRRYCSVYLNYRHPSLHMLRTHFLFSKLPLSYLLLYSRRHSYPLTTINFPSTPGQSHSLQLFYQLILIQIPLTVSLSWSSTPIPIKTQSHSFISLLYKILIVALFLKLLSKPSFL